MELLQVSELTKHFQRPSYTDFLGCPSGTVVQMTH